MHIFLAHDCVVESGLTSFNFDPPCMPQPAIHQYIGLLLFTHYPRLKRLVLHTHSFPRRASKEMSSLNLPLGWTLGHRG